jgi:hypothetical protein
MFDWFDDKARKRSSGRCAMRRSRPFVRITAGLVLLVAALVTGTADRVRAQHAVFDEDAALRQFQERVESYASLHRRLCPPPAAVTGTDPISKLLTRNYLAVALRGARRYAQQGEIFTPGVATLFQWKLADSIGERDGETFLVELNGGEPMPRGMHPDVNEPYTMTPLYRIPPEVRLGLPPIPAELDYRIAARDLVLWDIYAGVVVDFVPDVLTSRLATE